MNLIDLQEAARRLGVSTRTARRMVQDGRLTPATPIRPRQTTYVEESEVARKERVNMTQAERTLATLATYQGSNPWQDVIVLADGYDEEATEAKDPSGMSDIAVFEDGSRLVWIESEGEWVAQ